jgi:hypothetical protein
MKKEIEDKIELDLVYINKVQRYGVICVKI